MSETVEKMKAILANQLETLGWTKTDSVAIASREYPTAVGYKQALIYVADYGPDNDSVLLQGDYQSEGRNALEPHCMMVLRTADEEQLRQKAVEFSKNVDKVIMTTYAARLMAWDVADQVKYWMNNEIPQYLNKFSSFEDFDKAMPSACASYLWKQFAYAMAKERWAIPVIQHIPS